MSLLFRLTNDTDSSIDELAENAVNAFITPSLFSSIFHELPDLYNFLREQPALTRLMWNKLIQRHNEGCQSDNKKMSLGTTAFPVPCCCCGSDPFSDNREIAPDLDSLQDSLMSTSPSEIIVRMANYRSTVHDENITPGILREKKHPASVELFSYLTSENEIDSQTAEYLFKLLQRNDCIAEHLYSFASAAIVLFALSNSEENPFNSTVVSAVSDSFADTSPLSGGRGGTGGTGGGGGGCCCCCCCCCCGGGC